MHYYKHHIGDFIKATSCLDDSQAMRYLRLIWLYYDTEQPLPDNTRLLSLKVGGSPDEVLALLEAFFKKSGDSWHHTRCDFELSEYAELCKKNQENGKLGGRPKKTQSEPIGFPVGTQTEPTRNPNHKPVTNNQSKPAMPVGFLEEFWPIYPKKEGKAEAAKAFAKAQINGHLPQVIAALKVQIVSKGWDKDKTYCPNPATWLRGRRWEDETESQQLDLAAGAI